MPRPLRIQYEDAVYHVTSRGNERRKIFLDNSDRGLFLRILSETVEEKHLICHAWVLMDNHYHLMVETPQANLSEAMKHLNGVYTQKFNRKHHRVGHLFQGRYKAINVDKDIYLKELCRYVVLNPVRAKMVERPKDWKWSSYRVTAGMDKAPKWMEINWILGQFGKKMGEAQRTYKQFVEEGIKRKNTPWESLRHKIYLGEEEFLEKMGKLLTKKTNLDVPRYQKQVLRTTAEKVISKVSRIYGVKEDDVLKSKKKNNEARDVAIYLLKKAAGLTSKEVAKKMGVGASAVGNRWSVMKERLGKEPKLAQRVNKCYVLA